MAAAVKVIFQPPGRRAVLNAGPKREASQATRTGYAAPNIPTPDYLPAIVKEYLSTAPNHLKTTLVSNDEWRAEHGPAAEKRFLSWVIGP